MGEVFLNGSFLPAEQARVSVMASVGSGMPGPLWRQVDGLYQAYKARVRFGHA